MKSASSANLNLFWNRSLLFADKCVIRVLWICPKIVFGTVSVVFGFFCIFINFEGPVGELDEARYHFLFLSAVIALPLQD